MDLLGISLSMDALCYIAKVSVLKFSVPLNSLATTFKLVGAFLFALTKVVMVR